MRAVTVSGFGATPTLTDVPPPKPGPGEILVQIRWSSLNGFDVAVAAGMFRGMMEHRFPLVLGRDFAGTVEAVGGEESRYRPGDELFGVVMKPVLGDGGGFADYVTVSEGLGVAQVPTGLDLHRAGALGLAATAALNAVDAVAPTEGEVVLVSGASGGVGGYAIQLAAARGSRVIATARPGPATAFVTGLGAAEVVDFTGDLSAQVRAIAPHGVAAALHLAGDPGLVADQVAPGGRFASTLGVGPDHLVGRDLVATAVMAAPDQDTLSRLAAEAAAGRLRVPITRTYRLVEVGTALAAFAGPGTIGKLAVDVS